MCHSSFNSCLLKLFILHLLISIIPATHVIDNFCKTCTCISKIRTLYWNFLVNECYSNFINWFGFTGWYSFFGLLNGMLLIKNSGRGRNQLFRGLLSLNSHGYFLFWWNLCHHQMWQIPHYIFLMSCNIKLGYLLLNQSHLSLPPQHPCQNLTGKYHCFTVALGVDFLCIISFQKFLSVYF